MPKRTEGHFSGHDRTELFYQTWTNEESAGTLVITHGISEHSECYNWFANELNNAGWNVYGWDLRGHGRSEGKRGLVNDFSDYCKDLLLFIEQIRKTNSSDKPMVLFGHSMGGLITSRTLIENPDSTIKALCLSSPAFGISLPVPFIKDKASHFLAKFAPGLTLKNEINYAALSHDPDMLNFYPNDPLRHDKISARLYLGMVDSFKFVLDRCQSISLPVFLQVSGDDLIVSLEQQEVFYKNIASSNKEMIVYKDSYHEIFNDVEKVKAMTDLSRFLKDL